MLMLSYYTSYLNTDFASHLSRSNLLRFGDFLAFLDLRFYEYEFLTCFGFDQLTLDSIMC